MDEYLKGETVLYGEIIRVERECDETIQFKTLDGVILHCSIAKLAIEEIDKKLHKTIGLKGIAEYDLEKFEIQKFSVKGISSYEKMSLIESFQELSELIGDSFDAIDNLNEFLLKIRYS